MSPHLTLCFRELVSPVVHFPSVLEANIWLNVAHAYTHTHTHAHTRTCTHTTYMYLDALYAHTHTPSTDSSSSQEGQHPGQDAEALFPRGLQTLVCDPQRLGRPGPQDIRGQEIRVTHPARTWHTHPLPHIYCKGQSSKFMADM